VLRVKKDGLLLVALVTYRLLVLFRAITVTIPLVLPDNFTDLVAVAVLVVLLVQALLREKAVPVLLRLSQVAQ
jgi:hypothetical protein